MKYLKNLFLIFAIIFITSLHSEGIENKKHINQNQKSPDFSTEFNGKDTCKKFNRAMFTFNSKLNKYVIRPINIVWASIIPKYGIERIDNIFTNLDYPSRLAGCLTQGDFKGSKTETLRFLTNSTIGLAGMYDPAKKLFKLNQKNEDIAQALAYHGVKKGPYLFLPFIGPTNPRNCAGEILETPLKPSIYLGGPVIAIINGTRIVNTTTSIQDIITQTELAHVDPYEVTKQFYGVDRYSKIKNFDRITTEKNMKIKKLPQKSSSLISKVNPDIKLENFNPQSPSIDSFRTVLFDRKWKEKSAWLELSIWNRTFNKRLKKSSVKMCSTCPKYKYRYLLQKQKKSPLAIIYPTMGADIYSKKSISLAKMLYKEGYSVIITSSTFHWKFIKSMPKNYRPGYLPNDAYYLRILTKKILDDINQKTDKKFEKKIVVGSSWGALSSLFVAAQEDEQNTLDINKYISLNPPIDLIYAAKQIDKFIVDWKSNKQNIKVKTAQTLQKINHIQNNSYKDDFVKLPLNESEARLVIAITMKQNLSNLILAIEEKPNTQKEQLYKKIIATDFYDYIKENVLDYHMDYLDKLKFKTSLYSLENFIKKSNKIKIFHTVDDYFVSYKQLKWLKEQAGNKMIIFSNGSHLGYLYRKEFEEQFKKEIELKTQL